MSRPVASHRVETIGADTSAGSMPTFFASRGSREPTNVDQVQMTRSVTAMMSPMSQP
ncbi:hypothetical protein GCM10009853_012220 [Glycomyces scopariae]